MKTNTKQRIVTSILAILLLVSVNSIAQTTIKIDKESKTMHLLIEKEVNGETIKIDTVIDPENFDPNYFEEKYGINLSVNDDMKIMDLNKEDQEYTFDILIESDDVETKDDMEMNVWVTNDGEEKIIFKQKGDKVIKVNKDGGKIEEKIIIKKNKGGEEAQIFFINDEMDITEGMEGEQIFEVECEDGNTIIRSKIIILDLTNDEKALENIDLKEELIIPEEEKLTVENLKFYPNPTTGLIKFTFKTESSHPVDIKVYDIAGKLIYSEKDTNFNGSYEKEIDLSHLEKGTYFLKITQNGQSETKKVILN